MARLSRSARALRDGAKRTAAMAPREQHVSEAARAVPGAFPSKHSSVTFSCVCHKVLARGEFIVRLEGGGYRHALCQARFTWHLDHPRMAALVAADRGAATSIVLAKMTGRWDVTVPEAAAADLHAPGWREMFAGR